jgi:hypothetical protein
VNERQWSLVLGQEAGCWVNAGMRAASLMAGTDSEARFAAAYSSRKPTVILFRVSYPAAARGGPRPAVGAGIAVANRVRRARRPHVAPLRWTIKSLRMLPEGLTPHSHPMDTNKEQLGRLPNPGRQWRQQVIRVQVEGHSCSSPAARSRTPSCMAFMTRSQTAADLRPGRSRHLGGSPRRSAGRHAGIIAINLYGITAP